MTDPNASPASGAPLSAPLAEAAKPGFQLPVDPFRALDAVVRHARQILIVAAVVAQVLALLAFLRVRDQYVAAVQLIRQEPPNAFRVSESGEAFKPRALTVQTVLSLMKSNTLLQRVSAKLKGAITPGELLRSLNIVAEKNTEIIRVEFKTAAGSETAARVINAYVGEVVALTREMQSDEATVVNRFLKQQIARSDEELRRIGLEIQAFSREAKFLSADKEIDAALRRVSEIELKFEGTRIEFESIAVRIAATEAELAKHSPSAAKLQSARDELSSLLTRLTDENPLVKEQRARIAALEKQAAEAPAGPMAFPQKGENGVAENLFLSLVQLRAQQKSLAEQTRMLDELRKNLTKELGELPEKEQRFARLRARQQSVETARLMMAGRQREAELFEENALGYYRIMAAAGADDVEVLSRWRKIFLALGAGLVLGLGGAAVWFAWRATRDGVLRSPADFSRVVGQPVLATLPEGVTTATAREAWAFRTWTTLRNRLALGDGGLVCGWLAPAPGVAGPLLDLFGRAAAQRGAQAIMLAHFEAVESPLLDQVLAQPADVLPLLETDPLLHVHIPGDFAWDAARRKAWRQAEALWREYGIVVFLEITRPEEPESVLLAEQLPQVVCLGRSGEAREEDFAHLLVPYQTGECQLRGVAVDRAPLLRPRWLVERFGVLLASAALGLGALVFPPTTCAETLPARSSAVRPKRAAWQEKLTLGAGDIVRISVYGHPELGQPEVTLGADGRITFLNVNGFPAAGLTIDELRERLTREVSRYYQNARVVVAPVAFLSKRVYVLGKVVNKGAIVLERPLTILEAVAEAGGLETGLYQQNTVELADLPRSLLVRKGKRLPVDFEKLFMKGDQSQNLALEPDDYIFFPSSNTNEFHLLGAVARPGTQGLTGGSSVISALSVAGGFTDRAWRRRILVVRGSLTQPKAFIVDLDAILAGRSPDFRIEPRDLIYVADRPWAKVEDLLSVAMNAFTQAAVASWTGANIGPIIKRPLIPSP
ncbi:MAG: polysaccharide biosynthesis/export family protein [Verrucomicrobia bacterium]|nr:polysaccharide biosynthesis/export family protein [Verrucomicrobiota bacterium]